jgi:dephospho-CoA kinase
MKKKEEELFMIIGVTGKSGSGKTTFAKNLKKISNCIHLEMDRVAHEVLKEKEIISFISKNVGKQFIINKKIDRKKLGEWIFNNRNDGYKLISEVIYKKMQLYIDKIIKSNSIVIIDWILLPTTKYFNMCNQKYLIKRDEKRRIASVMERDNITREYLELRDSNSPEFNEEKYDYIIYNQK